MVGESAGDLTRRFGVHAILLAIVLSGYLVVFGIGFTWTNNGFFHRYFDQVSYRFEAARVADALEHGGLLAGLGTAWQQSTAQGVVYPLIGGVAYRLGFDPVYATFGLFLCVLAGVWSAFSRCGRAPWLGWLAIALITSMTSLLQRTGGPIDFRPDFTAQCLWTLAAAFAYTSSSFASRRSCIALGVVLGFAFCTRSLTLAYAAAALPMCIAAAWLGNADGSRRRDRLANVAITTGLAALIAAPMFIAHFDRMWDYYVDNHISAAENEARGFHGSFGEHLHKYTRSLRRHHLGWPAAALMVSGLAITWRARRISTGRTWPTLAIAVGFATPIVVMSLGPQFSSTVSGVVAGAVVLAALIPGLQPAELRRPSRLAAVAIVLGLGVWPARFLYKCANDRADRATAGHHLVATQHDAVLRATEGHTDVVLSTLPLIEAHSLAMLELVGYERTGRLPRRFGYGLGHQIYEQDSPAEFERRLRASDVVLWWDGGRSGGDLPANREAESLRPLIARVLAEDFVPAEGPAREISLEGSPLRLFFRRP